MLATPAPPTTPEVKPKVEPRHPQHHHHRLTPPKVIDSTVPIVTPPSSSNSTSSNSAASTRPMKPLPLPKQQQQQQQPAANSKTLKKEEKVEITENGSRRFRCGICDIGFRFQVCYFFSDLNETNLSKTGTSWPAHALDNAHVNGGGGEANGSETECPGLVTRDEIITRFWLTLMPHTYTHTIPSFISHCYILQTNVLTHSD